MSQRVRKALADVREAEHRLTAALREDHPIGSVIEWQYGGRCYRGRVVRHSCDERIKVRNIDTDRERWIGAYRVTS